MQSHSALSGPDTRTRGPGQPQRHATTREVEPLALLGAPSMARVLRYYLLRPLAAPHTRQLQRILELGAGTLERDLRTLVQLGLLERFTDGRLVRYRAVPGCRLWSALRLFLGDTADPVRVLREALHDVEGLEAAFVFGSTAKGTAGPDSDLDVFVVEQPTVDRRALYGQLAEAGVLVGREVNPVRYTRQTLAERLGDGGHAASHFVREVLAGPKRWLAGTPEAIRPLATAAGLAFPLAPAAEA